MSRLTYGAEQLQEQAMAFNKKAILSTEEDADGLGVFRVVSFDKKTSEYLGPLMQIIADDDPRIEEAHVTEAGYLHVTFVAGEDADDRTPYPLDEVAAVLKSD